MRIHREVPNIIGFFNPVIPTQNFVQPRSPNGCFSQPTCRANFQYRIDLGPIFLKNPKSPARDKGNPGSRKIIDDPSQREPLLRREPVLHKELEYKVEKSRDKK